VVLLVSHLDGVDGSVQTQHHRQAETQELTAGVVAAITATLLLTATRQNLPLNLS
jgi:hypothetical protein